MHQTSDFKILCRKKFMQQTFSPQKIWFIHRRANRFGSGLTAENQGSLTRHEGLSPWKWEWAETGFPDSETTFRTLSTGFWWMSMDLQAVSPLWKRWARVLCEWNVFWREWAHFQSNELGLSGSELGSSFWKWAHWPNTNANSLKTWVNDLEVGSLTEIQPHSLTPGLIALEVGSLPENQG